MEQKDPRLSPTEQAIASQLKKLKELYETKFPPSELDKDDLGILEALHNSANITCYKSASHTVKIENQVHACILEILQGINIKENKIKLERLKAKDRQNMPYKGTHMAGISVVSMSFCLLIAAALVVGLIGLPAGLIFFLPLLIIGVVGLVIGAGSIKKGMFDNGKLLDEAWGHGGRVDEFINSIKPEVEGVLIKANTYLRSNVDHPQQPIYPSPLRRSARNPRGVNKISRSHSLSQSYRAKSSQFQENRDQSPFRRPPDQPPSSPTLRRIGVFPRTRSLSSENSQTKKATSPKLPQVHPESSQQRDPTPPHQ